MKRYTLFLLGMLWALVACTDKEWPNTGTVGNEEVWATLAFGHQNFDKIDIKTRATLNEAAESRIENLYVYVFDSEGNRVYSHFYDYTNRQETLPVQAGNYWTVTNRTSNSTGTTTQGKVMIKSPTMQGGSIYVIANLNADQLHISADQLSTINSLADLRALTVVLNQEITSRTGYFLMEGSVGDVNIGTDGKITQNGSAVKVQLVRLDAKVTVKVKVGDAKESGQEMKDFIPQSWQVMRLPKATKLLPSNSDADEFGYFDSPEVYFESDWNGEKSFSFYMLENKEDVTGKQLSYNDRDLRRKKADGSYDLSEGRLWENASEEATYLIMKGKVQMEVNTNIEGGLQFLEADVVYYVHLGNFGSSVNGGNYNDFTVNRNTHYTYTITITGVNSIKVEVENDIENQSGATGHVYQSKEEIFTFDAHYGQRVFCIEADAVNPDKITWYVKTPFGKQGTPPQESGTIVPDLDYKWVTFLLNEKAYNDVYLTRNRWYPGDKGQALQEGEKLMDVVEFTQFLKEEKLKLMKAEGDEKPTASAFRSQGNRYCLYVTAFVNEYFYEADPLNSEHKPKNLWKQFVNQPNRLMHILSDTKNSKDGASSMTSSILTIRQRSIQTPYSLEKTDLETAFGCETVDETRSEGFTFYESDNDYKGKDMGNNSTNNGLYNTACLWNMLEGATDNKRIKTTRERWDTYLNYSVNNNTNGVNHFLKEGMESMRYASMSRNRDNNGNGVIDPEEVRWYIAPLEQLYALYVGDLGLVSEAQLYPASLANLSNRQVNGKWQWRNHIVCSNQTTITNSGQYIDKYWPEMLWAEEGVSISGYGQEWTKKAPNSIRCIRNLGVEDATEGTLADKSKNIPEPMINVNDEGNGVYSFDLSNINDRSARYFTTNELIPGNENAETSRTYYGFITDSKFISYNKGYSTLKTEIETGKSPAPIGYRIPNVREAALMSLYCPSTWWGNNKILSCSYYTHGEFGTGYDKDTYTWVFMNKYITLSETPNCLRCVKDWNPTTN